MKRTILIIEDDQYAGPAIRRAVLRLAKAEKMEVEVILARNVEEAVIAIVSNPVLHGIILDGHIGGNRTFRDAHLPDDEVQELIEQLRELHPASFMIAASSFPECRERMKQLGCDASAEKQVAPQQMIAQLAQRA